MLNHRTIWDPMQIFVPFYFPKTKIRIVVSFHLYIKRTAITSDFAFWWLWFVILLYNLLISFHSLFYPERNLSFLLLNLHLWDYSLTYSSSVKVFKLLIVLLNFLKYFHFLLIFLFLKFWQFLLVTFLMLSYLFLLEGLIGWHVSLFMLFEVLFYQFGSSYLFFFTLFLFYFKERNAVTILFVNLFNIFLFNFLLLFSVSIFLFYKPRLFYFTYFPSLFILFLFLSFFHSC